MLVPDTPTDREKSEQAFVGCGKAIFWVFFILSGMGLFFTGFDGSDSDKKSEMVPVVIDLDPGEIQQDTTSATGTRCDPSYPDFCIERITLVGDLECDDIGRNAFTVQGSDPHHFDDDGDGIGCEPWP